jgi:coiled-coil domain-containing protein 34
LEREKLEAEVKEKERIADERKEKSDEKLQEWLRKKQIEAESKMARVAEMKKKAEADAVKNKPKELKKAINFQDWLAKKNEELISLKTQQQDKNKLSKDHQKLRQTVSSSSYSKWIRASSSKPKPVPMNQGLESLRGSNAKIYKNPVAWQSIDDWN